MIKSDRKIIVVKNWQVVIGLVVLIVQVIFAYGTRAERSDDTTRRVTDLEHRRVVDWDAYQNEQKALQDQLNRVEGKLDQLLEGHR